MLFQEYAMGTPPVPNNPQYLPSFDLFIYPFLYQSTTDACRRGIREIVEALLEKEKLWQNVSDQVQDATIQVQDEEDGPLDRIESINDDRSPAP